MAVDVRIVFSGLCMFVPEIKEEIVHVLMPNARGDVAGTGHSVPQHYVALVYDRNATFPQGASNASAPAHWVAKALPGCRVDVAAGKGLRANRYIDVTEAVRLAPDVRFNRVDRKYTTRDGEKALAGRVVLHGGGQGAPVRKWSRFCLGRPGGPDGPRCQRMAEHVPWTIKCYPTAPGNDDRLDLRTLLTLTKLGGGTVDVELPTLYSRRGSVQILLIHAIRAAFPKEDGSFPELKRDAMHFAAYYKLASDPPQPNRRFFPQLRDEEPVIATREPWARSPSAFCSTSQATFA
jgi:hypothetical protein